MFFKRKSQIDIIIEKLGPIKGSQMLTYYYTYVSGCAAEAPTDFGGKKSQQLANNVIDYILDTHGKEFADEFLAFLKESSSNKKLLEELRKAGKLYINEDVLVMRSVRLANAQEISPSLQEDINESANPTEKETLRPNRLGRDESKHISCDYQGHEHECPKECAKCAISIKTDGDIALRNANFGEAVRLYQRALFLEPKFAEAYVNLGNSYGNMAKYTNALEAFNNAIALDPTYGKALFGKAITLQNMGKLSDALAIAEHILTMYNAEEVKNFKVSLLKQIETEKELLRGDNAKIIKALDDYGFQIMIDNNLISNLSRSEIEDIFQEDFIAEIMNYCRKKYAPDGEFKLRSEYIITTFYASICTVIYHSRNKNIFKTGTPFAYLQNHVDLEFTDVQAEKLLHINENSNEAELIWEIIEPFIQYAQTVFNELPILSDEIILAAMNNAYTLGIVTAFRYV